MTPVAAVDALRAELSKEPDPAVPPLRLRGVELARVRPLRWLWPRRLPVGYLSLLLGAEGVGKGTLLAWIIAAATRGELHGDLDGTPVRVLVVGDEDSFDSVTVPRLFAAGADLDLVDTLAEDELDLSRDAPRLRAAVQDVGHELVVFDQLLDNLGTDVDDWRSKQVRDALRPLRHVVRELDITALASLHPNKGARSSFRDLVSGTHAFNALSRSSLLLAPDPSDEERRVLVRGKGNLSAPPPSFEFSIVGRTVELNGHTFDVPLVTDRESGDLTVDDLLKPAREAPVRDTLAEQIDALGTGAVQTRADIARKLLRDPDDRSVGRALDQLEADGHWQKVGRGKWQKVGIGIGASREAPMSTSPGQEELR